MDLLISPTHLFGILAEYSYHLIRNSNVFPVTPDYEGTIHLEAQIPNKAYSILSLQVRGKKIVYNKILEWKLATHYGVPEKVIKLIRDHIEYSES